MKKLVPRLLIISSQMLIGALFLMFTVSGINEVNYKVNSKDIDKLSRFVYNDKVNGEKNIGDNKIDEPKVIQDLIDPVDEKEQFIERKR